MDFNELGGPEIKTLVSELESAALSDNTRVAYGKGWNLYLKFRAEKGLTGSPLNLDEETACEFLVWLCVPEGCGLSTGSAMLYRQGVARKLKEAGEVSPFDSIRLKSLTAGLLRRFGKPPRRVKALLAEDIVRMMESCGKTKIGRRDAAILGLGFACALRRSEVCGLEVRDVEIHDDFSMTVLIRRSKTDKASRGQKIRVPPGIKIRPGAAVCKWFAVSGIKEGPLFQTMNRGGGIKGSPMHHSDISRLVKSYASRIGLDPREVSGHSLRAGFVTSAARQGARLEKIMEVTRHVQLGTLIRYIREEDQLSDHAGEGFL